MDNQTEGVVLKSIPFQDHDQIITLYTPDMGLINLMVKWGRSKKSKLIGCLAPLTHVEVVYRNGRGELGLCRELSPINQFQELRTHYDTLEKACEMIKSLTLSQWPGKPSALLYQLLLFYLKRAAETQDMKSMVASFKLKILLHDGLLHLNEKCLACSTSLEHWYIADGETYCKSHAPHYASNLDAESAAILARLATTKSFQDVCTQPVSDDLYKKVMFLFEAHFEK